MFFILQSQKWFDLTHGRFLKFFGTFGLFRLYFYGVYKLKKNFFAA